MKKRAAPTKPETPVDSELDEDVFTRAMADVRRLPPDRRGDRVPARPIATDERLAPTWRAPTEQPKPPIEAHDGSFAANGVDRRELRKLKRGEHPPGEVLDVHGMTSEQAVAAVSRFIDRSHARYRCVCIIHGRGLRSPRNVPVLKARVRELLRGHRSVLAFADAPPNDGGPGAVYVLLRR